MTREEQDVAQGCLISFIIIVVAIAVCLTACNETTVLHPLNYGLFSISAGSVIYNEPNAPGIVVEEDGWYVSDYYLEEIMRSKIE